MDTRDLNEKGLKLRREMFGNDAVDKRMKAFGAFGEPGNCREATSVTIVI